MNKVLVNAQDIILPPWSGKACEFALKVLDEIGRDNWELSMLFCGQKTITELNSKYRNKAEPTDILSFNLGETLADGTFLPGDIVISLEGLKENSEKFGVACNEELQRLIIHGILHLDGMQHETNDDAEPMLSFQEELLARLKGGQIIGGEK